MTIDKYNVRVPDRDVVYTWCRDMKRKIYLDINQTDALTTYRDDATNI